MRLGDFDSADLLAALQEIEEKGEEAQLESNTIKALQEADDNVARSEYSVSVFLPQLMVNKNKERRRRFPWLWRKKDAPA